MKKFAKRTVQRIARLAAKEFVAELRNADLLESMRVKIDVEDALLHLSTNLSKHRLQDYYAWNHRWVAMLGERNRRTAESTYDFIETHMPDAVFLLNQMDFVKSRRDDILELDGEILDLGVYKGGSTRALCRIFPDTRALCRIFPERTIHGFDSFEGLPEDWSYSLKGSFGDVEGRLPDVPDNAKLYKGWFDETLPVWAKEHSNRPISLLRIDCDIYSSTKTILDELGHLIRPGTWILFDELIGYSGWEAHEYRALREFFDQTKLEVEYIAYGLTYVLTRMSQPAA